MQTARDTTPRLIAAALLLGLSVVAAACTDPGSTPVPSAAAPSSPPPGAPSSAPDASGGDSPFPTGDACSIATACPSPTE